jgi:beta-glucosidase-like glycosyl hydrolase
MQGYPQTGSKQETIITTFLAGVDLFAIGPTPETQLEVLDALKEGFENGQILEERINESVIRIIQAKAKLNKTVEFSLEEASQIFGSDEHKDAISPLLNN